MELMDSMEEAPRIREGDCLAVVYADLRRQAKHVQLHDADAREQWVSACGDLLAQVPDEPQRASWSYFLARDLNLVGCPMHCVVERLLDRAQQVRR